jgi:lipopolysaccharide/colanic/teichoic acid biosynthesis glycosyltransferase
VKFLETYCPGQRRVIALLDAAADMTGRTISGIPVVGPPDHLQVIIDEFAEHGTSIDRVVVGGDEYLLPEETLKEVQRVCVQRAIPLHYVPELVGLSTLEPRAKPEILTTAKMAPAVDLPAYFKWKYALDFAAATAILILYAPILVLAGGLALLDVGWPAVFWQQRVGIGRQGFKIYKIRTMRPPFDQLGQPWPEDKRLSWVGTLLRRMRLDELPQLVNVLVGDMSLIGPRPLLPCDQPSVRLMIRPGITGWAQVNGGTLLSPSEKDALDEWYIRNASFWLDLRIIVMTLRVMIWGQHRSDQATLSSPVIRSAKPIYLHANESAVVPARRLVIPSPILSMGTKSKRARV